MVTGCTTTSLSHIGALDGRTPSEEAGIEIDGNKWLTLMKTSLSYQKNKKNSM